ncbi:MAG: DUF86 domain-containing protein [Cyanobacteria bacterium RI_101]|nr:DUF86 domain-containing protein [Cyanobacteria bacterium RI_101]
MSSDQEIMLDLYNSLQKILMFIRKRNRVVHEYKRVGSDIIWETIQSDITLVLNIIDFLSGE